MIYTHQVVSNSVDELVVKGIKKIRKHGYPIFNTDAGGDATQLTNMTYVIKSNGKSYDRVHRLRKPDSVQYLAGEIIKYFTGTLKAYEMARIAIRWLRYKDANDNINSNYGYYAFYQKPFNVPKRLNIKNQYEWCRYLLLNPTKTSRKAVINIMGISHHGSNDLPCTYGIHFFIEDSKLNCIASMRSTDVVTGLPYDMGFFSLLNELMCQDLNEHGRSVKLGYTMIQTDFTQIYSETDHWADRILDNTKKQFPKIHMPIITSAKDLLIDIKNLSSKVDIPRKSEVVKWCIENAKPGAFE